MTISRYTKSARRALIMILSGISIFLPGHQTKANGDDDEYSILPSQHQSVLAANGAPLLSDVFVAVAPDPFFFRWIQPGQTESPGLNFEIAPSYLNDFVECSDSEGHLNGFHGIIGVRFFDNHDREGPNKLAYAMTHDSWSFHSDESQVDYFLSKAPDHELSRAPIGRTQTFTIGEDGSAWLTFYRSPSNSTVFGLCVKTDLEPQPVCDAIVNTDVGSFDVDVTKQVLERESRLECLVHAVTSLQAAVGMREVHR